MATQSEPLTSHRGCAPEIRRLATTYPELSQGAIARKVGCTVGNVSQVLSKFLNGGSAEELRDFQDNKADLYDVVQQRILESITGEDIAKAPLVARVTSLAILEDKARLVRGQATGINAVVLMDLVDAIRAKRESNQRTISGESV